MNTSNRQREPLGDDVSAPRSPGPIVVGVDGSPESTGALRLALRIAELINAPVHAVLAWQYPAVASNGYATMIDWSPEGEARRTLDAAVTSARGAETPGRLSNVIQPGPPASVLIDAAQDASLLVVGGRGHGGFAGLLLGSVSEAVARHAPCPVLVAHGTEHSILGALSADDPRPLVVGVDGSPASLEALRTASEAARLLGVPLEVVTVWHEPVSFLGGYPLPLTWSPEEDARTMLERSLTHVFGSSIPEGVTTSIREGATAPVLLESAAHGRALVMGARGHGGFAGLLLGSATDAVVRHSPVPVLIVPDALDREARIEALSLDAADGGVPGRHEQTARDAAEGEQE